MFKNNYVPMRAVVGMIAFYHIALGVLLNCPADTIASALTHWMGATKIPDASALFIARMLGTYMLVFGCGMAAVAWNPLKNRALLTLGAILVLLRALQRLLQSDDLHASLGITSGTNWATIGTLLAFALFLAFFRLKLRHDMNQAATADAPR